MKHQRIVAKIQDGHLPARVRTQIAAVLLRVKNGSTIIIEMFDVPQRRTAAQNDGFHAMIRPWAAEEGHDIDDLKRDLLGTVFGWEDSPLGATRVPLQPSTSALTKEQFSELITRTVDIAASTGYILQLPSEYITSQWMPQEMRP